MLDHGEQTLATIKTAHELAQGAHDRRMDQAGHDLDVHQALNPPPPKPSP